MGGERTKRLCKVREQFAKVAKDWFYTCLSCGKLRRGPLCRGEIIRRFFEERLCNTEPNQPVNGRCFKCTFSPPQSIVEDGHTAAHERSPTEIPSSDSICMALGINYYHDSFCLPIAPESVKEKSLYKHTKQFVFYNHSSQDYKSLRVPTVEYSSDIFSLKDFYNGRRLIQTLHNGDFGRVGLITVHGHQDKYVLKSFGLQNSDAEVSFLVDSQSKFVVKLHGSLKSSSGRLLFLDHYQYGSLDTLTKYGKTVPEETAVWTIAHLYAATDYVHSLGTLHLDITPANVLIDNQGYPILTDFGKARKANDWFEPNTKSFSKVYSCPELRNGGEPCKMADYWSIACCLYELLKGRPPVFGDTAQEALTHIYLELKTYLTGCSIAAYDFLTVEFHPDPRRRIGIRGISVIMMHQLFNGFSWTSVKSGFRSLESPLLELLTSLDHTQPPTNENRAQNDTRHHDQCRSNELKQRLVDNCIRSIERSLRQTEFRVTNTQGYNPE